MKCYCEECDARVHSDLKKSLHKRKRITTGKPYKVKVLEDGDNFTFPKTHDWVKLNYRLFVKERNQEAQGRLLKVLNFFKSFGGMRNTSTYGKLVDSTYGWVGTKPVQFQVGCSGPCIHLQIVNCSNVAAMDSSGMSDPYVAVWWKDTLVGTTRVIMKNRDPSWANETFVVPLEKEFVKCFNAKDKSLYISNKNKGKEHHHHDPNFYRPGMKLSPYDASKVVEEVSGENALAKLPKLRLDVFDYDRLSKNDFMGQKTFSDNEMLQILFEQNEDPVRNFHLEPKKARGVLGLKLSLIKKDETTGQKGERSQKGEGSSSTLLVQITDGKHLPKADPFSLSDPYCTIKWNDEQVGKTKIIKNTLDPLWSHAYFEINLTPGKEDKEIDEGELTIEVWDWDRIGGDDRLGILTFKAKEIRELTKKSDDTAGLPIDDNVLRIIEDEWNRLEGTPKQSEYKVNILHKIDVNAQKEREKLRLEHEAEKMRILQEKIDAGLETPEERRLRKTMEKEKRRKERATARAANIALKKELRKRGLKSMADRASRDTRETRDTRVTQGESLSAMLAAAKAEV
eukprot:CAMPEP_0118666936 /NCGR_PEP_ID=MMETSP0785-20121206/19498_1 /TAXON_ID=91992 /ORGANISM="Bolidomonas pacifica, Strain CCMP 1866" /LENGTH=567 /DNA_ID=CAMNT_0006561315 /DNA_START=207 /DNA_END=1907 /DNA_ORIENTATION=+